MELILVIGLIPLLNCLCGLITGKMYYFYKTQNEFLGSVKIVSRDETPVGFWVFFLITLSFGVFVLYFMQTRF